MAVTRCPNCGKPNPDFLDACQYCDQPLQGAAGAPSAASTPPASGQAKPPAGTVPCPNCGKPNPDFLDACQFCDQPLKGGPAPAAQPPAAGPVGEDVPDWLKSFQTESAAEAPLPPGAAAPAEEMPDWLKSMQTDSAQPATQPAEEIPDWLKSMQTGETAPAAPAFEAQPATEAEVPDWLKGAGEPAAPAEPAGDAMPDWLKEMHTGSLTESPAPAASPFGAMASAEDAAPEWGASAPVAGEPAATPADLPDWLSGMGAAAEGTPAATPTGEMPDWLKEMHTGSLTESPAATPFGEGEAASPAEGAPDWLSSMGGAPAAPTADDSSPSWLSAAPTAAGELPDWLKKATGELPALDADQAAATPDWMRGAAQPAAPAEEVPDWLSGMGAGHTDALAAPALSAEAPLPAILPGLGDADLMKGFETEAAEPVIEDESPDWLKSLGLASTSAEPAAPALDTSAPVSDEPDWIKSLRSEPAAPAEPGPLEDIPSLEASAEPDWLSSLRSDAPEETPARPTTAPFTAASPFAAAAAEQPASRGAEPDWLSALRPEASAEFPEDVMPATPSDIAPGELPSWLRAMRPVDVSQANVEPEVDDYEEPVGVLAGMRGILRAEPVVVLPGKAAARVHALVTTDAHTKQATLLARMLKADTEAAPAAKRKARIIPWERLAITAVMFLVMAVTPFAMQGLYPAPANMRPETAAAYEAVSHLTAERPVLVAFDYEPAQAGELEPVAEALVSHLARRGLPIVGVSTSPTGAALAEMMLADIAATYAYTDTLLNLGYLPGGPIGLAQFALMPRSSLRADFNGRATINGVPLWDQPLLASVKTLGDFGAVVLISASPESARAWLEQTRAVAPDTRFVIGVSAGAEPLVRPYYESADAPIAGLVSGFVGAAQYQQKAGLTIESAGETDDLLLRWETLGTGLMLAALLMVFGNVIHLVLGLWRRRKA